MTGERAGNLADAISAKVETDAGIFVTDCGGAGVLARALWIHANKGHDEFVCHAFVVGIFRPLHCVGVFAGFAISTDQDAECFSNAIPATIAVHSTLTTTDSIDLPNE